MQVLFLRTFPLGRLGFVSFSRITQLRHLSKSFLSLSISSNCEIMTVAKKPFERLPSNVVPKNYGLTLQPNLTEFTFTGKEVIDLEVTQASEKVKMNCLDIDIKSANFTTNGSTVDSSDISYDKEEETVTITFPSSLPVGKCQLHLDYTGELNDKMKGFYRSKYTSVDGEEKYCAVTQFEPTDARRAFPCWDEPAMKATFDVTLVVPKDRVALSNMDVEEEKDAAEDASLKCVKYTRSPIMSTYLLAFVVGEFDFVEGKDSDGVVIRVYTPKGKTVQGKFALEVAEKTLPFYKDYFDIRYPLPKMDLIAIPDFAAGAMENWGLVTYRETALLVDPENSSSASKQWVALVVGHELAHQWFGNLITMEWWTDLWLNEGFASWIEYLCVDHCFPQWDIWTQFVTTDFSRAMDLDALNSSHPIEVPVGHPAEIDEIFDAISYSKGASVIRMLHDYVGEKAFKEGLVYHLDKFKYNNATTEDLWASLAHASSKPVAQVMETWTKQMGFPVLSVTAEQKGDCREVTISQSKFFADGVSQGSYHWQVPVNISSSANPGKSVASTLMDQSSCTITLKDVQPDQWIKLNPGQVGFYRVQYSFAMLEHLLPAIRDNSLPPRDRLGLESDLFALCRAGLVPGPDVLKVIEAFKNETNFTVWNDLIGNMAGIGFILQYADCYQRFKAFCIALYGPIMDRLGWDPVKGEGHLDALLRGLIIACLGKYGKADVVAEANKRFDAHCKGESAIPADLRSAVYGTVLKHGDASSLDAMMKLFREADLHEEKVRLMRTMGNVSHPELIKKVLDFSMSDEVRSQDTVFVIAGVTCSVEGRKMAWKFVQEHWQELHDRYEGGFLLSRLVKSTTEMFASEEAAKEVEEFFSERTPPSAERALKQSLENVRLNSKWLTRESSKIGAWLKEKGY
ncbi:puromycin-sensitive aminopeptidase-like isoform X1 [Acropora millepora]|uniref:puromycin-sensitive aminopeptidase-like isoform X1 n=1 Tax=Acropora millepora TaxID=45264 RepID=UPI001CF1D000|nr:puromycin-sensitive aminopeptidase-like isoform X1 [Acropora millepora]